MGYEKRYKHLLRLTILIFLARIIWLTPAQALCSKNLVETTK